MQSWPLQFEQEESWQEAQGAQLQHSFLGRTDIQCRNRWNTVFRPSITKLKGGIQARGGKHWGAIAELVPGSTNQQYSSKRHGVLDPSIDQVSGWTGKWTEDKGSKLKDTAQYKRTVAKSGVKLARWSRVERKYCVMRDCTMS